MDGLQYYLTKLAEEAAEVAQIALKAQQFGPKEVMPGQPLNNFERCHFELDDLQGIIEELNEYYSFGYIPNRERIEEKKKKVRKFLKYSESLGMVTGKHLSIVFEVPLSETAKLILEMTEWVGASWGHAIHERDMALSGNEAKGDDAGRYLTLVFAVPIPAEVRAAIEQNLWTAGSWSHVIWERDKALAVAGMPPHDSSIELGKRTGKVLKTATLRMFEQNCPW